MINPDLLGLDNVTFQKFDRREFKRGLDEGERPFPVTPRIAPYEVKNPIPGAKTYRWCSCGMSRTQPICDKSHVGTKFKPLKFRIEEETDAVYLCGWKLSTTAPFCDSRTWVELNQRMVDNREAMRQATEQKSQESHMS